MFWCLFSQNFFLGKLTGECDIHPKMSQQRSDYGTKIHTTEGEFAASPDKELDLETVSSMIQFNGCPSPQVRV